MSSVSTSHEFDKYHFRKLLVPLYIMEVKSELLFFFSALGAFNGILLSLYFLFIARPKHVSNVFLGGLLLSLSIRIGKSVLYYFIPELALNFRHIGLIGCFFIGPFLYLYFRAINRSHDSKETVWKIHLITLATVVLIGSVLYPYRSHVELWDTYVVRNIYHLWLVYSVLAAVELFIYLKRLRKDGDPFTHFELWLLSICVGNALIWLSYYLVGWSSYLLGALLFSFMFYLLVLLLINVNRKKSILLKTQARYKDKKIAPEKAKELMTALNDLMEKEQCFKNPNLKLSDLAKSLNIAPHTLSKLLNDSMNVGFSNYINEWRIEEAKNILARNTNHKLVSISQECGFNSTSTFYTTFKKLEGLTPSKFRDSLSQELH